MNELREYTDTEAEDTTPENTSGWASVRKELSRVHAEHFFRGDAYIWSMVFFMMALSLILIFSATTSLVYKHHTDDIMYFLTRRFIHIMVALVALFSVYRINSSRYYKHSSFLFWGSCFAMLITIFVGESVNGATRSLGFFQPSDFGKIGMIIMLSHVLTKYKKAVPYVSFVPLVTLFKKHFYSKSSMLTRKQKAKMNKEIERNLYVWRNYSFKFLMPIVVVFALIVSSNLSTAILVGVMGVALLLMGGIRFVEVFKLAAVLIISGISALWALAATGIMPRTATWMSRLTSFFSGEDSFQMHHAKVAIAQGWIPRGPGTSLQRANLPRAESDFMFAFIVEEYSVVAAVVLSFVYLWLFQRAIKIAKNYSNRFESLLCVGLSFFLVCQALVHCMVNVGLAPVTGLVLPFLSNGGSGIVSMSIAIGIILNVSMHQKREEKLKAEYQELYDKYLSDTATNEAPDEEFEDEEFEDEEFENQDEVEEYLEEDEEEDYIDDEIEEEDYEDEDEDYD